MFLFFTLTAGWPHAAPAEPVTLTEDGQPKAAIFHRGDAPAAATDLADFLKKISGASLEVKVVPEGEKPEWTRPALVLGRLALEMGLPSPPQTLSGDGYRIRVQGGLVLLAGERPESTHFAACHFLEALGCRWFFDNDLGEVVSRNPTVRVDALDVSEQPDFISRNIWGPNWHRDAWKRRNRMGGLAMSTGHDWGHVPAEKFFKDHPEYYALRGGERRAGNWLCTSNPTVQRLFAESLGAVVAGKGVVSVSISPPDGRGYCECEPCKALDDPNYLEPSSGTVCISDRYQQFYNAVAESVLPANPAAILNFYAYADYSLPPRNVLTSPANLCVWMAPIRFCRFHSMSHPECSSRQRLREVVEGWRKVVPRLGWREYNYNLAELTAPFSKVSIWKEDIPYLHRSGCLGLNIETLALWHIYGPHTYLAARLAWDAEADVEAVMDDFYTRFCGRAAPAVKRYWERIDRAYRELRVHAGCFYSLHAVWTPTLVEACTADLDEARQAAETEIVRKRVDLFQKGLDNVQFYLALREATNRCDFARAKEVYGRWLAHMDAILAERMHAIGEYKYGYVPRFLGKTVEQGAERVTGDRRLLLQLPDEWLFRYDPRREGEAQNWHREDPPSDGWLKVKTYSATLNEQGIPEQLTWMWYRTELEIPEIPADRSVFLWFAEADGRHARVFINGQPAGELKIRREPFELEVTGKLRQGRNLLTVALDHTNISELMLGGIIKPVMLYTAPRPPASLTPK